MEILRDSPGFRENRTRFLECRPPRKISNLYFGDLAADCNIQLPVIVPLTDVRKNSRV